MTLHRRALLLLALAAPVLRAQAQARPSESVSLRGSALQAPRTLAPSDLAAQPATQVMEFAQPRGAPGAEQRSMVRGVRLVGLIEPALTEAARADWKNLLVTVTATDGYRAQFTWAELSNTAGGYGVLLLFERDGRPLDEREGRIALLATGDQRLGPRHVRNVLTIEVRPI